MPLQTYVYNRITYFVDYRLQQFRSDTPIIKFYDFRDPEGDRILTKMMKDGVADTSKLRL